jgi:5-oxoprolinase (ATP-hydrolysing) subunit A
MKRIDLNCDLGELPEMIADGTQEALMKYITTANVACGGHAGDEAMMQETIEQAMRHGVAVAAHPGYEDKENFGRVELVISAEELTESVHQQVARLDAVAKKCGAQVRAVKAHGALYNQAARDAATARAIAEGVRRWRSDVVMVGLAGSVMLAEFRAVGFLVAAEAFADRRYEKDGSLRARRHRDALLAQPEQAAEQAVRIAEGRGVVATSGETVAIEAQTLCVHGDTPGAERIAAAVRGALVAVGVEVRSN